MRAGFRLSFVLSFLYTCCISSQNLISNGGFDIRTRCPNRISQVKLATGWLCSGSPDLFCNCTSSRSAVYARLSFVGSLLPYSGDCYAGMIVNARYKEYITFELPEKMRRRRTYCLRFLYARSIFSGIKVDSIGILLHREMYRNAVMGQPMRRKSAAVKIEDHPGAWTAVSFTFNCRGGERFITLGSFGDDLTKAEHLPSNKNLKNIRIFNYSRSGYYFIEDVELFPLSDGEACLPCSIPTDTISEIPMVTAEAFEPVETIILKKPFVLHQLNFETAKSAILPTSFDELNELADHLISQPELHLTITGHTDNRGSGTMNLELSAARAKAVADYLVTKGVLRKRITWRGLGHTHPVADNLTETGRRRNRRVEFQFN